MDIISYLEYLNGLEKEVLDIFGTAREQLNVLRTELDNQNRNIGYVADAANVEAESQNVSTQYKEYYLNVEKMRSASLALKLIYKRRIKMFSLLNREVKAQSRIMKHIYKSLLHKFKISSFSLKNGNGKRVFNLIRHRYLRPNYKREAKAFTKSLINSIKSRLRKI